MGLLGKLTGADAANKKAKGVAQKVEAQKQAALGELTPEAFQEMLSFFMPLLRAQSAQGMQFAMQQAAAAGARSGALGSSGVFGQLQAGIPGQFALKNLSQGLGLTSNVQSQRAGIISGSPVVSNSAGRGGLTDLADLALQFYTGGQVSTGATQSRQTTVNPR